MIIYLTGFMAAGKSHLAEQIARAADLTSIDLDREIEIFTGNSIAEIFESRGEAGFRKLESQHLSYISRHNKDFVMACGGGVMADTDNIMLMQQYGIIVFVDTDLNTIIKRLTSDSTNRPLISGLKSEEIKQKVGQLYKQRLPHYRKADIAYNPARESVEDLLYKIKLF